MRPYCSRAQSPPARSRPRLFFVFRYVDFFDATGTFFSMANYLNNYIPNFVDFKTKRFERQLVAYCVDGVSIIVGALLGTSPLTVYIESAAGIREGARTGIAALVIMMCFAVSLFFSPLIAAVPPYATGPALILVGSMMMLNIVRINWSNTQEAVPAFLTIAIMVSRRARLRPRPAQRLAAGPPPFPPPICACSRPARAASSPSPRPRPRHCSL